MKDWSFSRFQDCVTILIGVTTLRQVGEASYALYLKKNKCQLKRHIRKVWNDWELSLRPTKVTKWNTSQMIYNVC